VAAAVDPTEARFPAVPLKAGHYESFYLKLCRPGEPLGAWIRYTVHKRPREAPVGSLWFTLFEDDGPRASKLTLPAPVAGEDGEWIRVGEASLGPAAAVGEAEGGVAWELRFETGEPPLFHLPRAWMYRARLPRTKLLSPAPAARFDGRLSVDSREIAVEGWRGMVGHNWGSQHAERWIWLHGVTANGAWLDAAIGRVKVGPLVTPWVGNGAISIDGSRHALGGRGVEVREAPDRCEFVLRGRGIAVRGTVSAPRERFVGWIYTDPDGSEHQTVNCSIADMRLTVERKGRPPMQLTVEGGAAYELGMRESSHGVEIQPYRDG
jgi:hypothetical protein